MQPPLVTPPLLITTIYFTSLSGSSIPPLTIHVFHKSWSGERMERNHVLTVMEHYLKKQADDRNVWREREYPKHASSVLKSLISQSYLEELMITVRKNIITEHPVVKRR